MTATPDRPSAPGADRPLTVPLLVRGSLDNLTFITLSAACLVFAGIAVYGWFQETPRDHGGASLLLGLSCLFGLPALLLGSAILVRRRWLEVTLTGFVLTRQGRRTVFDDEEIVAVRQKSKTDANAAITRRSVRIEVEREGRRQAVDCFYKVPFGQVDPLAVFLDRVIRGLARRMREKLPQGALLAGKGWRIDRDGLHCKVGRKPATLPFERLTRAGIHDGAVCVWKDDDERPFLRVGATSSNAYPLAALLHEVIASNPARPTALPGKPLGRIVLERLSQDLRAGRILAAIFLALMVPFVLAARHNFESGLLVAILPLIVLPLALLHLYRGWRDNLRFHEAGLSQRRRGVHREILYSEIGVMTWKPGRDIRCEPLPGVDRPPILYRAGFVEDADMAALRDYMASVIAQRWAAQLAEGPVAWTPRLRFLSGQLEYRSTGLLSGGEVSSAPCQMTSYRIENGWFVLFVQGHLRPVAKESLATPNFFPGLVLLNWIYASYRAPATGDPAAAPRFAPAGIDHRIIAGERPSGSITPEPPDETGISER